MIKKTTHVLVDNLITRKPELKYIKNKVIKIVHMICELYQSNNKILLCGNGGSCADCEHFSSELNKSFTLKRQIPNTLIEKIENLYPQDKELFVNNLQQSIACIPLPSFISTNTAFANDNNYLLSFAQLLYSIGKENDILICFSTSGNSKNIVYTAKLAKALNIKVISFTNKYGGELKKYSDILVNVPSDTTFLSQEYHLSIYHSICLAVENQLFD